jgi:hypothetical protein
LLVAAPIGGFGISHFMLTVLGFVLAVPAFLLAWRVGEGDGGQTVNA